MTGRRGIGRIGGYEFEFELELELLDELELELFDEFELELLDEFELELLDELELELFDEFELELLDEPPRLRLRSSSVAGVQAAPPSRAAAPMATALSRHGVRPVLGMAVPPVGSAASFAAAPTVARPDETLVRVD
jgi:hypothetical protein